MELEPDRTTVQLTRVPLTPGRYRYRARAMVSRKQDLVLRAADGEIVLRCSGRRAIGGLVSTAWVDERADLSAAVVTIG